MGDLHVENFGTWRDAEGRLVWGVNDFDEAAVIPFAFDLVRLATSAWLAPDPQVSHQDAAAAILDGYGDGLAAPRPTLLDEQETWMRPFVACSDKARAKFWREVADYPPPEGPVPQVVEQGLRQSLAADAVVERFATRRKGGGGLGRPRFVALAAWRGGHVVREAKALVPSAWDWAHGTEGGPSCFMALAHGPHRAPDPFLGSATASSSAALPPTRESRVRPRRRAGAASQAAAGDGLRAGRPPCGSDEARRPRELAQLPPGGCAGPARGGRVVQADYGRGRRTPSKARPQADVLRTPRQSAGKIAIGSHGPWLSQTRQGGLPT